MYGFVRATDGPTKGSYSHDFLLRGQPKMCHFMVRIKVKSKYLSAQQPPPGPTPLTLNHSPPRAAAPLPMPMRQRSGSPERSRTTSCSNEDIIPTIESIMETLAKNAKERREVNQKLQMLRVSRIHRRSSLGAGGGGSGWTSSNPTAEDANFATVGSTILYETPSCTTTSNSYYPSFDNLKQEQGSARRQSLVLENNFFDGDLDLFEPMDPFDHSVQPECASELIRLLEF